MQNKFRSQGFIVVSISLDKEEKRDDFKEFVKENEMNWLHIMDGKYWDAELAKKYGVRGIPAVYLIDPKGVCVADSKSLSIHDEEAFSKQVEEAMKKTPPTVKKLLPSVKAWQARIDKGNKEKAEAELKEREAAEQKDWDAAEKLLAKKEYAKAIEAFEKLAEENPDDRICKKAAEKAAELKADKKVTAAIMQAEADRRAPGLLKLAAQLVDNGKAKEARKYLQQVIAKYPGTTYAETAKAELDRIGGD